MHKKLLEWLREKRGTCLGLSLVLALVVTIICVVGFDISDDPTRIMLFLSVVMLFLALLSLAVAWQTMTDAADGLVKTLGRIDEVEKALGKEGEIQESLKQTLSTVGEVEKALDKEGEIQKSLEQTLSTVGEVEKALDKEGEIQKSLKALGKEGEVQKKLDKTLDKVDNVEKALGKEGEVQKKLGKTLDKVDNVEKALGKEGEVQKKLGKTLGKVREVHDIIHGTEGDKRLEAAIVIQPAEIKNLDEAMAKRFQEVVRTVRLLTAVVAIGLLALVIALIWR